MTVSYRMTMADTGQYLGYLLTQTLAGRLLVVVVFVAFVASHVISYHTATLHHIAPSHHAASSANFDHLLALRSVLTAIVVCGMTVLWVFVVLYVGTLIAPTATITIDPEFWHLKTFMTVKSPWKQFATIVEEADYFCFVGWTRAFLVPKRAFNSSAEAYAFFDEASAYWRKAKGIALPPAPDVSGVWPPAPRAGDSQELGQTPKG